jgi:outer membrane protein OmpA-like peptidoglycan-associated protein
MTRLINGRTPEQYSAWNRWHAIIAALLALLLLILWFSGKGPGFATASGSCCSTATPVAATPVAPAAEPAVAPIPAANLYFDVDKFEVPSDTGTKLLPIVEYLKANPSAVAVISGYHDPTGDKEHNIELAKNRAGAVRDFLMTSGIEEARIDMQKPLETTGGGSLEEARRVEVSVRP